MVNEYLEDIYHKVRISEQEKAKVVTSFGYLKEKLWSKLQDNLERVEIFGSFDRGTALSSLYKEYESDIDVLVLFKSGNFQPQTYLDKLKKFAEIHYNRSEIFQDHPTIVIQLNHARFELVPGYGNDGNINIPASKTQELKWINTEPSRAKFDLKTKDQKNGELITPLIVLFKYWNKINGSPFDSHYLEDFAINHSYGSCYTLEDYFYEMISDLNNTSGLKPETKQLILDLYEKRRRLKVLKENNIPEYLEPEIKTVMPHPHEITDIIQSS